MSARLLLCALALTPLFGQSPDFSRDPKQAVDDHYTQLIRQYTTAPAFNSPLTDYLPASQSVPAPDKVLGDVAGAPNMLPYAEDVYRYFRMLAAASPRIQVFSIGRSEEGREMIAAAIADESLLAQARQNGERLAQLADPRLIQMDDAKARPLIAQSFPVYYITGTIHSPETGAPTALMELAYRLIVDNSPYIQHIRSHMITLITPVVEVDGRDRMVDLYKWHKAHPGQNWPHLIYWGHYVAHDNNRDAMAMTLNLTRNVLNTYLDWHAQVLHDLHESIPFLYDNTVGDGPYNAWIDPVLADEWSMLASDNMAQMQNFGMPGAFTHGDFDTWSPGYLMFLAGLHNGISRLYETFGNGGADTEKRILSPDEYSRTWYRQNPPYPTVTWSQRDNNNYEETALLSTLSYFSQNTALFLNNFYLKSKRSIRKPLEAGPAAYVLAADDAAWNRQMQLLDVLSAQHVEIQRLTAPVTIALPPPAHPEPASSDADADAAAKPPAKPAPKSITYPTGSFVIRMDQPFSRVADALLDRQYWSPTDQQKHPYDDTGWSFGDLFDARATRVTDAAILAAKMEPVASLDRLRSSAVPAAAAFAIANSGQTSLAALVYALKSGPAANSPAAVFLADKAFENNGAKFPAGSLVVENVAPDRLNPLLTQFDLKAVPLSAAPASGLRPAPAPRIAFLHTWLYTQTEGWWRIAFDKLHVPYAYISTQTVAEDADLRSKYDVIVFAPIGHIGSQLIVDGLPMIGNPLPWQKTDLTPNLGRIDSTPDMRPGLGAFGLEHLKSFVAKGGLLITSEDTASFAIEEGLAPGVFVAPRANLNLVGSVVQSVLVDASNPIAYGFGANTPLYSADGTAFSVSDLTVDRHILTEKDYKRPTGRGGPHDEDIPDGRPAEKIDPLPSPKPWQPTPLNEDQARNNSFLLPPDRRPRVVVRFADAKDLLLAGLLDNPAPIAEHAAVVVASYGQGNVVLFANNPVYRGETIGSYGLVFNAILNFDHLGYTAQAPKQVVR